MKVIPGNTMVLTLLLNRGLWFEQDYTCIYRYMYPYPCYNGRYKNIYNIVLYIMM